MITATHYNTDLNTWLEFESVPDEGTRTALQDAGFRYSAKRNGWWCSPPRTDIASVLPMLTLISGTTPRRRKRDQTPAAAPNRSNPQPSSPQPNPRLAERLRKLANGLQGQIDSKRSSGVRGQNPTPRRANMIAGMDEDARTMEMMQSLMRHAADLYDAGTQTEPFLSCVTKGQFQQLVYYVKNPRRYGGLNEIQTRLLHTDYGLPHNQDAQYAILDALKAICDGHITPESANQRRIRELEAAIQFVQIEGFHSTPSNVIDLLLAHAPIGEHHRVLEPSAGKGNIADAIKTAAPACHLSVCERHYSLREILEAKGYTPVGDDSLSLTGSYDRILMNPAFERGHDMDEVMHCYTLLADDGVLVAVMGAGAFFRSDSKATAFRAWLDAVGGTYEKIDGAEYGRDHGHRAVVQTYCVVIHK